jgi:hypothetical protein
MNFIVGFLYLLLNDEEQVFKFFQCLIEKHKMAELFKQDVPLLRIYFYQLDRLIAIFLPNLHTYLKVTSHLTHQTYQIE